MRRGDVTKSPEGPSESRMRVIVADDDVVLGTGPANLFERSVQPAEAPLDDDRRADA